MKTTTTDPYRYGSDPDAVARGIARDPVLVALVARFVILTRNTESLAAWERGLAEGRETEREIRERCAIGGNADWHAGRLGGGR